MHRSSREEEEEDTLARATSRTLYISTKVFFLGFAVYTYIRRRIYETFLRDELDTVSFRTVCAMCVLDTLREALFVNRSEYLVSLIMINFLDDIEFINLI